MNDKTKEKQDQQWFDEHFRDPLIKLEQNSEPSIPQLANLASLVHLKKAKRRKKMIKELALFWLSACFILSSMLWIAERDLVWFLGLQAAAAVGAMLVIGTTFGRGLSSKWKS